MTAETHRGAKLGRPRDPLLGTVINGRFRVEEPLARGGMGRLYLAKQAHVDRLVALKVVAAEGDTDREARHLRRFLLEASLLAKIQHPNVVTLFDYGRIEGAPIETYFIAMEYLRGETLAARLQKQGALSVSATLDIVGHLVSGLRETHARGVIHRDLKPSNIVLADGGGGEIAKLVDFGVGKLEHGGENLTKNGVLVGTPKYMAPEQFDGTSSAASDVYALGLVTYQMLVGALPFSGTSAAEFMLAKAQGSLRSMRDVDPTRDVPAELERLVHQMLARRPEDRPDIEAIHRQFMLGRASRVGASGALVSGLSRRPPPLPAAARRPPPPPMTLPPALLTQRTNTLTTLGGTPSLRRRPTDEPRRPVIAALVTLGLLVLVFTWVRAPNVPLRFATPPPAVSSGPLSPAPTRAPITLRIESTPMGAAVIEEERVIGTTPLDVALEHAGPNAAPRTFRLSKDGYTHATFTQAAAESNVSRLVVLGRVADLPSPQVPSKPTSPTPAQAGLEIRHRR